MLHACNTHLDRACAGARLRHALTRALVVAVLALGVLAPSTSAAAPPTAVRVLLPDADNLQLLAFWVALGAGYFTEEGVTVAPVTPPSPALAQSAFTNGEAPVAVLPAPVYERLIAERFPFVLVANLLANDPIELVVRRSVADTQGLRADAPLAARLRGMQGLRIGIAPHPRRRLAALFASQGLDVDRIANVVVVRGPDQNAALADGRVDALYAHTPFLENALLDQASIVLVNQSAGEVPALTNRQIHVLAVTRAFASKEPRAVGALVRGIARAETLIHEDAGKTTDAVLRALPKRDRAHVAALVAIYAAAVPRTPEVSAAKIPGELTYYPDGDAAPSFAGVDLKRYVAAPHAPAPGRSPGGAALAFAAFALLVALGAVLRERAA